MSVDIFIGKRSEGLIVHDDDIGSGALFEDTEGHAEILLGDDAVVCELHGEILAPGDVGEGGVVSLDDQEDFHALQHVVGIGIGAHANGDPFFHHLKDRSAADGVAHVGLRVVDDHGSGFLNDVHLGGTHMDAVAEQGPVPQDPVVEQAVHRPAAIVAEAVIDGIHTLRDVDVEAGHSVIGLHHLLKGSVGDREKGVAAEHGLDHGIIGFNCIFGKISVLPDPLQGLFFAVALGDLIAEAGPHACFLRDVPDGKKRTGDLAEAGVVVKDRRHAVADAVQDRCVGRRPGSVQSEPPVDRPPGAVEDLKEIGGIIADNGKAPGQPGIDMRVGIDQAGHDDAALRVDKGRLRILFLQILQPADRQDLCSFRDDSAVFQIRPVRISCNNLSVSNQKHAVTFSFPCSIRKSTALFFCSVQKQIPV